MKLINHEIYSEFTQNLWIDEDFSVILHVDAAFMGKCFLPVLQSRVQCLKFIQRILILFDQ
jgi:hypothetical protein